MFKTKHVDCGPSDNRFSKRYFSIRVTSYDNKTENFPATLGFKSNNW